MMWSPKFRWTEACYLANLVAVVVLIFIYRGASDGILAIGVILTTSLTFMFCWADEASALIKWAAYLKRELVKADDELDEKDAELAALRSKTTAGPKTRTMTIINHAQAIGAVE